MTSPTRQRSDRRAPSTCCCAGEQPRVETCCALYFTESATWRATGCRRGRSTPWCTITTHTGPSLCSCWTPCPGTCASTFTRSPHQQVSRQQTQLHPLPAVQRPPSAPPAGDVGPAAS